MTPQIKPWRYYLPIVSLPPHRVRRDSILRRCIGALQAVLADAVAGLHASKPSARDRRPEPPPIRWEM